MKKLLAAFILITSLTILLNAVSADFSYINIYEPKPGSSSSLVESGKREDYYGAEKAFDEDSGTTW